MSSQGVNASYLPRKKARMMYFSESEEEREFPGTSHATPKTDDSRLSTSTQRDQSKIASVDDAERKEPPSNAAVSAAKAREPSRPVITPPNFSLGFSSSSSRHSSESEDDEFSSKCTQVLRTSSPAVAASIVRTDPTESTPSGPQPSSLTSTSVAQAT